MELVLKRKYKKDKYTIGYLFINSKYFCDTLEDKDRNLTDSMTSEEIYSKKIYGETAIPYGTYKIDLNTVSSKFKDRSWAKPYGGKLPRLMDIKGFNGILIHVLNQASESLGCIGVGRNTIKGKLTESTKYFKELMTILLKAHIAGEELYITIK